jgi:hypothetical protein
VLVGAEAEVLDSLTSVLGTTEDQGVGASGGTEGKLVESDGLTAGSEDTGAGGGGESESGNGELGDRQETVVVGHGAHNYDDALLLLGGVRDDAAQRDGGAVDLRRKEAAQHDLVEAGVGTT